MNPVYYYYGVRFVVELLLAAGVYVWAVERRQRFALRLALSLLVIFGVSALLGHLSQFSLILKIARYIILFLLAAVLMHLCFALDIRGALFYAVSAYATQHIMIQLWRLLLALIPLSETAIIVGYLLFIPLCYGVAFFLVGRQVRGQDFSRLAETDLLALCTALMIGSVVLSLWFEESEQTLTVRMITTGYSILCCTMILLLQFSIARRLRLQNEMAMSEYLREQERKQYQIAKENMELINIKCHDMRHVLTSLEPRITEKEKKKLSGIIELYDTAVKTGSEVLDVILSEKSVMCSQKQITLTCMADGGRLDFVEPSDLYSLFGNAIDNAIEAVSKVEDSERRIIDLVVTEQKGHVIVHVENFYTGNLTLHDGIPQTTKTDTDYHGFGMRSIRYIAEKHHGTMQCTAEDGIFRLDVLLPIPENN